MGGIIGIPVGRCPECGIFNGHLNGCLKAHTDYLAEKNQSNLLKPFNTVFCEVHKNYHEKPACKREIATCNICNDYHKHQHQPTKASFDHEFVSRIKAHEMTAYAICNEEHETTCVAKVHHVTKIAELITKIKKLKADFTNLLNKYKVLKHENNKLRAENYHLLNLKVEEILEAENSAVNKLLFIIELADKDIAELKQKLAEKTGESDEYNPSKRSS